MKIYRLNAKFIAKIEKIYHLGISYRTSIKYSKKHIKNAFNGIMTI